MANANDILDKAIQCHSAGDLAGAERLYAKVLRRDKRNPVALHLSGVIAYQNGDLETARQRITNALRIAPEYLEAHSNLGLVLHAAGDLGGAEASFRRALDINPDAADTLINLGTVLEARGETGPAADAYARAAELEPNSIEAHFNLGALLRRAGRAGQAIAALERARMLAPDSPDVLNTLGLAWLEREEPGKALEHLEAALAHAPDTPDILNNIGTALRAAGRPDDAALRYARCLEINPDYVNAHHNLGRMAVQTGDFDAAETHLSRTLALSPVHADAFFEFATNMPERCPAELAAAMRRAADDASTTAEDRAAILFGLSAVARADGDNATAIADLLKANEVKRGRLDYDPADDERAFESLAAAITPHDRSHDAEPEAGDARPIFILGMPRSGTTLAEQILAGHPDVTAAGEVHFMHAALADLRDATGLAYPGDAGAMTRDHFAAVRRSYLAAHARQGRSGSSITDKLPHNFLNLGVIRHAFPDAAVVHMTRDPVDTCFSIFEQNFTHGHAYGFDLAELGRYYRHYAGIMAAWRETEPDLFLDLSYEALVADSEPQIRRLLDHCELPFHAACLEPHKTARTVLTASRAQVRRPINAGSVKRWAPFANELAPLIAALEGNG